MRKQLCLVILLTVSFTVTAGDKAREVIVEKGIYGHRISAKWKDALQTRMPASYIDSLAEIDKQFTPDELQWETLIRSKINWWNDSRDSLSVLFPQVSLNDTIYVLLGCGGADDGFTYKEQTVCFDLTALQHNYGKAKTVENNERIDRLFAHEFTHLLQKAWAIDNKLNLSNFRDSILWECLYEGVGMYRSLNPKWLPVNNELPDQSKSTLKALYPIFTNRIIALHRTANLNEQQKEEIHNNLSRGPVKKKWGAFPVAIWLAMEAGSDQRKLIAWIDKGPQAVIELALKHLDATQRDELKNCLDKLRE